MTPVDLIIAVLATSAIVEVFRHSHLLSEWRVYWNTTPHFCSRLLRCGFCLSYWAAGAVVIGLMGPATAWPQCRASQLAYLVAAALAAARAAQLLNDLTHAWSRSPRREE